jgi:hypothetical protein
MRRKDQTCTILTHHGMRLIRDQRLSRVMNWQATLQESVTATGGVRADRVDEAG